MKPLLITEHRQLKKLYKQKSVEFIQIQLPHFTESENSELERHVNQLINPCGCEMGAGFLLIGLFFLMGSFAFYENPLSWSYYLKGTVGLILFVGFGKFLGILRSNIQLRKLLRKVYLISYNRLQNS